MTSTKKFQYSSDIVGFYSLQYCNSASQEVDPNMENEGTLGLDNIDQFLSDLANAILGIDEAEFCVNVEATLSCT